MSIPRIPRKVPSGPDVERFLAPGDDVGEVDSPAGAPTGAEPGKGRGGEAAESPTRAGTAAKKAPRETSRPAAAARTKSGTKASTRASTRASKSADPADWRELLGGPSIATSIRVPIELQNKLRDAAHHLDGWDMTRILVEGAARLVVELDRAVGGIPERPQLLEVELD